jgi:Family of unknown function (DUF6209)
MKLCFALPLLALLATACSATPDASSELASGSASQAEAPLTNDPASQDASDRGCLVVLRDVARPPAAGGYETECVDGYCWFAWSGTVDVSRTLIDQGATVGLMYQSGSDPTWWEVEAEPVDDDGAMQSFSFRFFEHTVSPGMSMTSLMRTRVSLIPVVHLPGGGRLFDHNRMPGDFDNYALTSDNSWAIEDDPSACATVAPTASTIEFLNGWQQVRHGAIVPGGTLSLDYALARLPECRGTHNGFPAWDTTAFVRFQPSGDVYEGSVRAFVSNQGTPTNEAYSIPVTVDVPQDATSVEIWFRNASGAGMSCETWDSNLNTNYVFEVDDSAPAPVKWAGDWGNGFSRECVHRDGISEPTTIDSYIVQRACMFVDADVYVPGLTDVSGDPSLLLAQVVASVDGNEATTSWLSYEGREGNNYRYRWTLPRQELDYANWGEIAYTFRFSTDGVQWFDIGQDGGAPRTIVRDY